MKRRNLFPLIAAVGIILAACTTTGQEKKPKVTSVKEYEVNLSEEEWRKRLTPEEFRILRQKGTEYAWTGEYNKFKKKGVFNCAGCGNPLFSSESKYDSGSGWPSYWKPLNEEAVVTEADYSHGMTRTEVLCAKCGGHLGHVFPDGPRPTGQRYCINSLSLDFEAKKDTKKDE